MMEKGTIVNYRNRETVHHVNYISYLPFRGAKRLAFSQCSERRVKSVGRVRIYCIAPPRLDRSRSDRAALRILQTEEDDDDRDGHTRIHSRRQDIVVLCPPTKVSPTDHELEDESDDKPGDVVDSRSRRNKTRSAEDDRNIDILEPRLGILLRQIPRNHRQHRSNKEEVRQRVINLSRRELSRRTDNTPDDTRGSKHLRARADESALLRLLTHPRDIAEHPRLHAKLGRPSDDGSNDLRREHRAGWELHVMTKLEVRCEGEGLKHGDVTPGLEQHHCDGTAGEGIADDELGNNVQTDLLIGDSLNHTNGNNVDE